MSEWHPFLLLTEKTPGAWTIMLSGDYIPFGTIEIRRVGDDVRYKVTLGSEVIGWATSLRVASERLWRARLEQRQQAISGPPNGRRGSPAE